MKSTINENGVSEESLHDILDDAINMGSGALNLFIADAMAKESGND